MGQRTGKLELMSRILLNPVRGNVDVPQPLAVNVNGGRYGRKRTAVGGRLYKYAPTMYRVMRPLPNMGCAEKDTYTEF
jgi:hypothetical protein